MWRRTLHLGKRREKERERDPNGANNHQKKKEVSHPSLYTHSQRCSCPRARRVDNLKLFSAVRSQVRDRIGGFANGRDGGVFWKTESPCYVQAVCVNSHSCAASLLVTTPRWRPRAGASGPLVDAGAAALLDGHPADGRLGRQLRPRGELLHQDPQGRVHLLVHLMDLEGAGDRTG